MSQARSLEVEGERLNAGAAATKDNSHGARRLKTTMKKETRKWDLEKAIR